MCLERKFVACKINKNMAHHNADMDNVAAILTVIVFLADEKHKSHQI